MMSGAVHASELAAQGHAGQNAPALLHKARHECARNAAPTGVPADGESLDVDLACGCQLCGDDDAQHVAVAPCEAKRDRICLRQSTLHASVLSFATAS